MAAGHFRPHPSPRPLTPCWIDLRVSFYPFHAPFAILRREKLPVTLGDFNHYSLKPRILVLSHRSKVGGDSATGSENFLGMGLFSRQADLRSIAGVLPLPRVSWGKYLHTIGGLRLGERTGHADRVSMPGLYEAVARARWDIGPVGLRSHRARTTAWYKPGIETRSA